MSEFYKVQERDGEFHVIDTRPDDSQADQTSVVSYSSREEAEGEAKRLNENSLG
ncbi:hypothetical protein B0H98_11264 [Vreelandella songnenensis]|uniref:DUF2188 family protein n=1 Tax=Vreelandella songnenensis TaxID=1176243 RepID=A0A2T0UU51_9GAMM|nr:hypothetical protein [Halomonas songnenensis]PRY61440.1 hypothetical protein B0H98_11264 [Halomonas songnenensis]